MEYVDIKYALAKEGYTLSRVARELDLCGPQAIYAVLNRKYISASVERLVSEITGIPLSKLFPDRYGRPKKTRVPACEVDVNQRHLDRHAVNRLAKNNEGIE